MSSGSNNISITFNLDQMPAVAALTTTVQANGEVQPSIDQYDAVVHHQVSATAIAGLLKFSFSPETDGFTASDVGTVYHIDQDKVEAMLRAANHGQEAADGVEDATDANTDICYYHVNAASVTTQGGSSNLDRTDTSDTANYNLAMDRAQDRNNQDRPTTSDSAMVSTEDQGVDSQPQAAINWLVNARSICALDLENADGAKLLVDNEGAVYADCRNGMRLLQEAIEDRFAQANNNTGDTFEHYNLGKNIIEQVIYEASLSTDDAAAVQDRLNAVLQNAAHNSDASGNDVATFDFIDGDTIEFALKLTTPSYATPGDYTTNSSDGEPTTISMLLRIDVAA